jgi:hypothetical protein
MKSNETANKANKTENEWRYVGHCTMYLSRALANDLAAVGVAGIGCNHLFNLLTWCQWQQNLVSMRASC